MSRRSRLLFAVSAVLALAAPAASSAGELSERAVGCGARAFVKPFTPWLDYMNYVQMPDGGLENGAKGWQLTGGATVVSGNERWYVGGKRDTRSLALPAGSSATTAPTCAGLAYPTMRFFVRRTRGSLLSTLRVDALYETRDGSVRSVPNLGLVLGVGTGWQPSLPMVVPASALAAVLDDRAVIAFRFRPSAGSSWRIDDVYLDPFAKH